MRSDISQNASKNDEDGAVFHDEQTAGSVRVSRQACPGDHRTP